MSEPESQQSHNNANCSDKKPVRSLLDDIPPVVTSSSSLSSASTPTPEKRLHVGNIPFIWREDDIRRLFAPFGEMKHVDLVTNERGSKGYGFVTMTNGDDADRAIAALSGQLMNGRIIQVNVATTRARKGSHNQPRVYTPNANVNNEQVSSEFGALLLQQKQLQAQMQLQQFLQTQQQTDMIASALGLPTSNLGGLLAGTLPYPAAGLSGLAIDPRVVQLQQMQSLLQSVTTVLPTQQPHPLLGQLPLMNQLPPTVNHSMYNPSEMTGPSSAANKTRSAPHRNDGTAQRFNPY